MKIDFSQALKALDGKPLLSAPDKPLILRDVCIEGICANTQQLDGMEKYRRGKLADKIFGAAEPIELPAEDVVKIKEAVGTAWPNPIVVMRAWDMLEGKE